MALDFPTSPTNGQLYTSGGLSYQYDSTYSVWKILPSIEQPQAYGTANSGFTVANAAFGVANAAFAAGNAEFTFSNAIYAAVNSSFAVINAAYTSSNSDYVVSNAAFGIANAAFNAANNAAQVQIVSVINSNTNAQKNYHYVANSTITLSLPGSPTVGDILSFTNLSGGTSCVINSNGANVMGTTGNVTIDTIGVSFSLVYTGTSYGWVFK